MEDTVVPSSVLPTDTVFESSIANIEDAAVKNQEDFCTKKYEVKGDNPNFEGLTKETRNSSGSNTTEKTIPLINVPQDETASSTKTSEPVIVPGTSPRKREAEESGLNSLEHKPDAKKIRSAEEENGTLRRSGRERKAVQRDGYVSEEVDEENKEGPETDENELKNIIPVGLGVRLGEIEAFVENFENIKASSPASRKLYKALFKITGRPADRKDHIMQWNGIPEEVSLASFMNDVSKACTLADLREIGKKLLGLTSTTVLKDTKQAWLETIGNILALPKPDDISMCVSEATPRSGGRGGSSAFQMFCSESRAAIQAEHPEVSGRELNKIFETKWRTLNDAEKQKYQGVSKSAGNSSGRKKSKTRQSRRQESSDEETLTVKDDELEDELEPDIENDV